MHVSRQPKYYMNSPPFILPLSTAADRLLPKISPRANFLTVVPVKRGIVLNYIVLSPLFAEQRGGRGVS